MKIIDKKIKKLIKSAARKNHRLLIVILGISGFHSIPSIHQLLTKINKKEITTLWCSRDGVSTPKSKDEKDHCDPDIRSLDILDFKPLYCSYNDLGSILHEAYGVVVLQDLDASNVLLLNTVLPNVKGGGAVILLLPMINSIEELNSFSLNSDKHSSRFGKRFIQSLDLCSNFLVIDDNLNLLSSKMTEKTDEMMVLPSLSERIESIKSRCEDSTVQTLLDLCLTADQAELLYKLLDVLKKRSFHSVVSAASAFGRGKSAALGLAIAGGIAMNYSNIFISSSSLNNVDILFRFLLKGLDALNYEENKHYDLIESANPQFKQALIGLNIFKDYPQSVRFIFPEDVGHKLEQAELVVIDEAASIPFHRLKKLFGPYVVVMSSSTSGAISTSPFLCKKMIENIQSTQSLKEDSTVSSGCLQTIVLNEPVHYNSDDGVEFWSNHIFCMESTIPSQLSLGCPETKLCELYCVSRDVLFSGNPFTEKFLKSLVSILNQSSYTLNVEELLRIADSPDYQIFVLLPPLQRCTTKIPLEVLCAIIVHIESNLPSDIVKCGSNLIQPVPSCFNKWNVKADVSKLRGLHIINLATHPQYKKMGYGLRAVQLLKELYEGKVISLGENVKLSTNNQQTVENQDGGSKFESPLLLQLSDLKLDNIDFMCVFFNLSSDVFSFWKKAEFVPLYMAANKDSDVVPIAMFKPINEESSSFVEKNIMSFINHYFAILKSHYKKFPASFALSIFNSCPRIINTKDISKEELDLYLKPYHMKSLEKYCLRLQELNTVIHIIPTIAKLYFKNVLKNVHLPVAQEAILLSYGLQNKSLDAISKDLELQNIQVVGLLNRTLKKVSSYISGIIEKSVESTLISTDVEMKPLKMDLDEELEEAAIQVQKQQEKLLALDVSQYAIKGSEDEWQKALFTGRKTLVSIKSIKNKVENENAAKTENKFRKHKKQFKKKKH
nr:RNA cytidine acetyltransferase isoform X2 [Parasteatoda tepidariorum]